MKCKRMVDIGRRKFLQGGGVGVAAAAAHFAVPAQGNAQTLARVAYPSERLAHLSELATNTPLDITYPDPDSPGVLLKLGHAVQRGIGPDNDIVAFSVLCPHKGWPLRYHAEDMTLNCPGHYSRFDCEANGQQVWGHATQNLPQFELRIDDQGNIFAEGVDELIYGRLNNVLEA